MDQPKWEFLYNNDLPFWLVSAVSPCIYFIMNDKWRLLKKIKLDHNFFFEKIHARNTLWFRVDAGPMAGLRQLLAPWEGNLLALSSSRLMTFNLITSTLSWHIQSMDRCRPPWRLPKEGGGHFQKTCTLGSAKNDLLYEIQISYILYFFFH